MRVLMRAHPGDELVHAADRGRRNVGKRTGRSVARSSHRRRAVGRIVLCAALFVTLPGAIVAAQSSDGSNERQPSDPPIFNIPIFERKHALLYRFSNPPVAVINPAQDLDRPTQTYLLDVAVEELIMRGQRQTVIRFDNEAELLIGWEHNEHDLLEDEDHAERPISENRYSLHSYLVRLHARRRAGSAVEQYDLSLVDGLTRIDRMGNETKVGMADALIGTQSLLAAMSRPTTVPCRNGAVLSPPRPSPILDALRIKWLDYALLGVLPPLPEPEIPTNQTWQAGFFVQPTLYAEPTLIRGQFRFVSFDVETGLARVKWDAHTASLPIHPIPGVHHVDENAIARVDVAGTFRIHVETGWVHSGNLELTSLVTNPDQPDIRAKYTMQVHLSAKEEPAEIKQERENRVGPAGEILPEEDEAKTASPGNVDVFD